MSTEVEEYPLSTAKIDEDIEDLMCVAVTVISGLCKLVRLTVAGIKELEVFSKFSCQSKPVSSHKQLSI
jgi:hypothetical protein